MTTSAKIFGQGTLTTTLSTVLVTVPALNTWRVFTLRIASSGATAVTLTILDTSAGTEKKILDAFPVNANSVYEVSDLILEAGDSLKGGATVTADWHMSGVAIT